MKKYAPFKNINLKNVVKFFYTDLYLPASNNSNITFAADCIDDLYQFMMQDFIEISYYLKNNIILKYHNQCNRKHFIKL